MQEVLFLISRRNSMNILQKSFTLLTAVAAIFFAGAAAPALADNLGQQKTFNVDKTYDAQSRSSLNSVLIFLDNKLYFYVDNDWWQNLTPDKQINYRAAFANLAQEFSNNIYPKLTATFGSEPSVGVDGDSHLTILVEPMIKNAGGYINTGDNYYKLQTSRSNERKMIYLAVNYVTTPLAKVYLAHEFMHLIQFNQKDIQRNISEETWLNEARAEYSSTFLGYDDVFSGSNLEQRVRRFLEQPGASLTEWDDSEAAYGVAHIFTAYLVDHYGIKILADSLKSDLVGIPSLNYALKKNGYNKDFSAIFNDWTAAVLINDCSAGEDFCYFNPNLKNLRISPRVNYLPSSSSDITLAVNYHSTYWAGNWQKIVGGRGALTIDFAGPANTDTTVQYLACDDGNLCELKKMPLDASQKGRLVIPDFGAKTTSLILMPIIGGKITDFDGRLDDLVYNFSINLHSANSPAQSESNPSDVDLTALQAAIAALRQQIAALQAQLAALLAQPKAQYSCSAITTDLYFGVNQPVQVRCLQEVLTAQGKAIYPEAKITGNFLSATHAAVIRFQEKYAAEILTPLGLKTGTGYVGASTRNKINQLIKGL